MLLYSSMTVLTRLGMPDGTIYSSAMADVSILDLLKESGVRGRLVIEACLRRHSIEMSSSSSTRSKAEHGENTNEIVIKLGSPMVLGAGHRPSFYRPQICSI